ncbi:MAG: gamma-glutamyltransferase [Xanthomonadales bacterium]|nr:gamma-glutamyltransferase [Xanthomonadales bacterium]
MSVTLLLAALLAGNRPVGAPFATRSEVWAPTAMVASSHPLATQIGLEVMRQGGNALDAAIAANAALTLMEPTGCGLGGDLFALVWDPKTRRLHGYNGSGRSPRSLTLARLRAMGLSAIPSRGPLPVTVPGVVEAWFALHARFGRKPMAELLAPTIRYAREGHPVPEVIADAWARSVPLLERFPGFREQFTLDGRAPRKGERWRNPNLARTLERIAEGGAEAFYRGEIAERIVAYLREQGGFLELEDLAAHRGEWVEPLSAEYRGVRVWQLPPNGQGATTLLMLNILEHFDFTRIPFGSAEHVHLFVEAKKLAFEYRARHFADPAFAALPVAALLEEGLARELARRIDRERALLAFTPDPLPLATGDTVYLATADGEGRMVSLIQSNFRGMGSGMAPPGLGFVLQNRGEQFVLREDHANAYAPGKRPFHTIMPGFLTRGGEPWVAFGVMAGDMQPQGQAQIVMNLVDFGMSLQEAGDAPRIHHGGSTEPAGQAEAMADGGELHLEPGFAETTVRELLRRGHRIVAAPAAVFGGYQAILRDPETGAYAGASESRKDGQAAGF